MFVDRFWLHALKKDFGLHGWVALSRDQCWSRDRFQKHRRWETPRELFVHSPHRPCERATTMTHVGQAVTRLVSCTFVRGFVSCTLFVALSRAHCSYTAKGGVARRTATFFFLTDTRCLSQELSAQSPHREILPMFDRTLFPSARAVSCDPSWQPFCSQQQFSAQFRHLPKVINGAHQPAPSV